MIHICTVHWKDARWIDRQLGYLERFIGQPYRVYSIFTDIDPSYRRRFFYAREEQIPLHEAKLNVLADIAWFNRESDDDWLIFIDGDAFPVADLSAYGERRLEEAPLLAIRRDENAGDIQPHPSFCLTTLGFWRQIGGDWAKGYEWTTDDGRRRTDVGAKLYEQLAEGGHTWYPMLRSNCVDLHPLYFGLYDDVVYHHGAGFRQPFSTVDAWFLSWPWRVYDRRVYPLLPWTARRLINHGGRIAAKNARVSRKVLERMNSDPEFFRLFQSPAARADLLEELGIDPGDVLNSG